MPPAFPLVIGSFLVEVKKLLPPPPFNDFTGEDLSTFTLLLLLLAGATGLLGDFLTFLVSSFNVTDFSSFLTFFGLFFGGVCAPAAFFASGDVLT